MSRKKLHGEDGPAKHRPRFLAENRLFLHCSKTQSRRLAIFGAGLLLLLVQYPFRFGAANRLSCFCFFPTFIALKQRYKYILPQYQLNYHKKERGGPSLFYFLRVLGYSLQGASRFLPLLGNSYCAVLRRGFTRLNFSACSGVVSGQSLSKVMGLLLACFNSWRSFSVRANVNGCPKRLSVVFAIINPPFKAGRQSCRNYPCHFYISAILQRHRTFGIYYEQNVT